MKRTIQRTWSAQFNRREVGGARQRRRRRLESFGIASVGGHKAETGGIGSESVVTCNQLFCFCLPHATPILCFLIFHIQKVFAHRQKENPREDAAKVAQTGRKRMAERTENLTRTLWCNTKRQ